jgi:hypothetical protein
MNPLTRRLTGLRISWQNYLMLKSFYQAFVLVSFLVDVAN